MNKVLIVFAKKPELGKVKVRLAKDVGATKALEIYTTLLNQTIATSNQVDATVKLYWNRHTLSGNNYFQKGNDIGEKMYNALNIEKNANKVCLIGSDIPRITSAIITQAFVMLDKYDIIFGPSQDGGYYLVALKNTLPKELFFNQKWSHKNVLSNALKICSTLGMKVKLMPTLLDIDTIDNYNQWKLKSIL